MAQPARTECGQHVPSAGGRADRERARASVKFTFRDIPDPGTGGVRPRPIVDVVVEGLEIAPQACLLDSGATGSALRRTHRRNLRDRPAGRAAKRLAVGGALVTALMAEVTLELDDGSQQYAWSAPVWFCEPSAPSFGLLGLTGFFDHFTVTIASYQEWFELTPRS